jgi:hypothetical protein
MIELVLAYLSAEGVAVNSQHNRCARLVAFRTFEHALDESLLKFADRFVKQYAAFHHLNDKPFQLISHDFTLPTVEVLYLMGPAC